MNCIRTLTAISAVVLPCVLSSAHAYPLRYSFYDCGSSLDCTAQTPTLMAQFVADEALQAPPVPAPGTQSAMKQVSATAVLAGAWSGLGLQSFNINGYIGSQFIFDDLLGANRVDGGPTSSIGPATSQGLALSWTEGTYLGLSFVHCYTDTCSMTTTIRAFSKLVVDEWTEPPGAVPEPGALPLVAGALAVGGLAMRRRSGRPPRG